MLVVTYRISRASPRSDLFYNFAAFVVSGNTLVYPRDVQHGTKWAVFFANFAEGSDPRWNQLDDRAFNLIARAAGSDAKSSTLNVSAAVPAHVASEVARTTYSTPRRRAISLERYGFRRKSSQPGSNHPRTLRSKTPTCSLRQFQFRAQLD